MGTAFAQRGPGAWCPGGVEGCCARSRQGQVHVSRWDSRWLTGWSRFLVHNWPFFLLTCTSEAACVNCSDFLLRRLLPASHCSHFYSHLLHPTPFDDCDATQLARSCCAEGQSLPVTHTYRQPQLFRWNISLNKQLASKTFILHTWYLLLTKWVYFGAFFVFLMTWATLADCNRNISKVTVFFLQLPKNKYCSKGRPQASVSCQLPAKIVPALLCCLPYSTRALCTSLLA